MLLENKIENLKKDVAVSDAKLENILVERTNQINELRKLQKQLGCIKQIKAIHRSAMSA